MKCRLIDENVFKGTIKNKRTPIKVNLITNYNCNLNCIYCDAGRMQNKQLPTEELTKLIVTLKHLGTKQINFIGGEPLVRRDIADILKFSKDNGIKVVLHSNCTLLTEKSTNIINNLDCVFTCINGPEAINDQMRGESVYKHTVEAINILKNNGIDVVVDMILTNLNSDKECISHLLGLAKQMEFKVNFQPVFDHRLANMDEEKIEGLNLRLNRDELGTVARYLLEIYDEKYFFNSREYFELLLNEGTCTVDNCYFGHYSIIIDPEGSVSRCYGYLKNQTNTNGFKSGWEDAISNLQVSECKKCLYNVHIEDNYQIHSYINS